MSEGLFDLMSPEEYYHDLEKERNNDYKRLYAQSVLLSLVLKHGDSLTDRDYRTLNVNKIILGNGMYKVLIFHAETAAVTERGIPFPNAREYAYYVLANVSQSLLSSHFVTYSGEAGGSLCGSHLPLERQYGGYNQGNRQEDFFYFERDRGDLPRV